MLCNIYKTFGWHISLVLLVFVFLVVDLEVTKFIGFLIVGDNSQPITQIVLLKVLLRQILQVPTTDK